MATTLIPSVETIRAQHQQEPRIELGVLLTGYDMSQQRIRELEMVLREAHKYLPYGGTRDWVGEVLGLNISTEDDDEE